MLRIDCSVAKVEDRDAIVEQFNNDSSVDACLLTTGVAGVGLNLVGATRVVILDPSWNPAVDAQAVDRGTRCLLASFHFVIMSFSCLLVV